ncbi:MAG: GtrA family protein [Pseudomonadota bacterium]
MQLRDVTLATLISEGLRLARYGIVGVGATLVHVGVALALAVGFNMNSFAANLFGFSLGFIPSFLGHYHWTFKNAGASKDAAVKRFLILAAAGFLANNVVLAALTASGLVGRAASIVLAIAIIPAVSYLGARFWAFRESRS